MSPLGIHAAIWGASSSVAVPYMLPPTQQRLHHIEGSRYPHGAVLLVQYPWLVAPSPVAPLQS